MESTRAFFDDMAPRYDRDLVDVGWDPIALVDGWPFVVPAHARVLDAGCGTGALLEHVAGAARVLHGFDLSPGMLREARRRRPLKDADLRVHAADTPWPWPDGSMDVVFSLAMLEFAEHLDVALDEAARVLAPFGRALVSVEDLFDSEGRPHPARELRYDAFPLWRRTREEFEATIPPGLDIVRMERVPAYTVLEHGYRCAYWVAELVRNEKT